MLTRSESVLIAPKKVLLPSVRFVCTPRSRFFFSFLAPPELSFPAAPSPLPLLCPWVCFLFVNRMFRPGRQNRSPLEKWNEMQIHRLYFIYYSIILYIYSSRTRHGHPASICHNYVSIPITINHFPGRHVKERISIRRGWSNARQ